MIVNTRRLFCRLLRRLDIATVCDVGSMDGADALRFRRMLPHAAILALEPNPRNLVLMAADDRLRRARIKVFPLAASDHSSEAPLFVVEADYTPGRDLARRGMSSLRERTDWTRLAAVVPVPTVRLDELLDSESPASGSIALWIDTEGMAFEVIRGASNALRSTRLIHVEVETLPIIGAAQKLFADVEQVLLDAGFVLLATDQQPNVLQFNALFISATSLRTDLAEIARLTHRERLRRMVARAIVNSLPHRVRHALGLWLFETRCQ